MMTDFALGLLCAATATLTLFAAAVIAALAWLISFLAKFAEVQLQKDAKGRVVVSAEVRAK